MNWISVFLVLVLLYLLYRFSIRGLELRSQFYEQIERNERKAYEKGLKDGLKTK